MAKMKFEDAMGGLEPQVNSKADSSPVKRGRPKKTNGDLPFSEPLDAVLTHDLPPLGVSHEPSPIFEKMRQARQSKPSPRETYYHEDEDDFLKANIGVLQSIFSQEEIHKFKAQYSKMLRQFKEDVLFSEELQVFHAIKFEILMDRCLIEIKKLRDEAEIFEKMRNELINDGDDEDPQKEDKLMYWTKQIESHRSSSKIRSDEHSKLFERYTTIMTGLKATREQRIKNLEGSNRSFVEVIRDMQKKDTLMVEGAELETYKWAVIKELMKLSMPHEFMDGSVTEPILSSETLRVQDYIHSLKEEAAKQKGNSNV